MSEIGLGVSAAYLNGSVSQAFSNDTIESAGSGTISAGTNPLSGLTIGTTKSGATEFSGTISEIIIYDRPLKSDERSDVFDYLSMKYRIPVVGL